MGQSYAATTPSVRFFDELVNFGQLTTFGPLTYFGLSFSTVQKTISGSQLTHISDLKMPFSVPITTRTIIRLFWTKFEFQTTIREILTIPTTTLQRNNEMITLLNIMAKDFLKNFETHGIFRNYFEFCRNIMNISQFLVIISLSSEKTTKL